MSKLPMQPYKTKLSSLRIALIYALVGGLWIIVSSLWAATQIDVTGETLLLIEIEKGLAYVGLTALMLWWLCRSWSKQIVVATEEHASTQKKYEAYVKRSPVAIAVIDKSGKFLEANEANEKLTGYDAKELLTKTIFDVDDTVSKEETAEVFREIFEKGHASKQRIIRRKDGTHADVIVDGIVYDNDKAICFSRDITERIHSERKLLMLNAMLRAIRRVNQAIVEVKEIDKLIQKICEVLVQDRDFKHAWIALLDADGRPNFYCDAPNLPDADKLQNFLEEGLLEDCLADTRAEDGLIVAKDPETQCPEFPIIDGLEECALLGMRFNFDHRVAYIALMAQQEVVDDEEEISLFREICGDLQYALHTIRVEREKTEAMKETVKAKREAEEANRAKDEFLAVMSHEMRTPLNPIIGFSEMLLEEITSEPHNTYVDTILQAGNRQLDLVNNILHYIRLHRGNVTPSFANFRLRELCDSVIHDASVNCPKLDLRLTDGAHGKPVSHEHEVVSDTQMIRGILDNLINNACKYTNEGHVYLDLSESDDSPGEFIFTVEDSGIGIEPETIDKLFEAFSQADSSYTRRHEGIGLGLAICKKLTDILEGNITATSTPAEGSTFAVRLPLKAATKTGAEVKSTEEFNKPADAQFDSPVDILAVDDKPDNLFVIEKILTRAGAICTQAENGAEAFKLCQEHAYDVILMDLAMPVMNGLDACKNIRAQGLNMETPIIAVTADATSEAQTSAQKVGMQATLTKPIQKRQLIETIRKFVQ